MNPSIERIDRISYAEAVLITGRSHSYLAGRARAGWLRRDGGTIGAPHETWLSRNDCESLAMQTINRSQTGGYWLTARQAGSLLGVVTKAVYTPGLFRHITAATGLIVFRRYDVELMANTRAAVRR